ncbi:MAG: alpha,alpha-trehalose-phosphate synthase (UDP-forming) [Rhizobiales bacterium]|nr:alpha,alpha-trehalose-phosphate synthase (UDP-forming) [Hyphomicrobiales bacterium]
MARLVIVSNRVAVPDRTKRPGGLEVALRAAFKRHPGVWFGWSGRVARKRSDVLTQRIERDCITYIVTDLADEDFQEFYNGFANRVLWPILHYRVDLAEFTRRDLSGYFRVNERFVNELNHILRPDDLIWVHDYHLIPLGRALRQRGHRNRIGFFLHIPFPPPEILTALPNHEQLIPRLTDYDLIAFQTGDDASNCARYLTRECGLHSRDFNFSVGDRVVRIDICPVGIDVENFARLARRAMRASFVREVLDSLSGRAMIIGVDRLDYSKGITYRMEAFDRFLAAHPEWRGKVTYLQITPKTRTEIPEYAQMEEVVNGIAGHINGTYGEAAWTPIRYVNKAHSRTALAGLYRGARVGLVTPLRDGMNLVSKEYVAAQNPDDPGVLILSQFAGAAHEMKDALLVNPYDPEGVGSAISRALSMPLDERQKRHRALLAVLVQNDAPHWADRFLANLQDKKSQPQWGAQPTLSMSESTRSHARMLR